MSLVVNTFNKAKVLFKKENIGLQVLKVDYQNLKRAKMLQDGYTDR
ncbi:hypothetical protein [Candidatus Phytoplasma solani]